MFTLSWSDDNGEFSIVGDYPALWVCYWCLRKAFEKQSPYGDIYMWIVDCRGNFFDLERGGKPVLAEPGHRTLVKRGL